MKTKSFSTFLGIALLCGVVFSFNSCKDKDDPVDEPSLSIKMPDGSAVPAKLEMSADAGSQKLAITSNGKWIGFKQGVDHDWITVTPTGGIENGEIMIAVQKNTSTNSREVILSYTVNGKNAFSFSVLQLGAPPTPTLEITPKAPETLSKDGADITFTITAGTNSWEYAIQSESGWLTEKGKTANSLTLTAAKNSNKTRTANVTFKLSKYPTVTQIVEITQAGEAPATIVADMLDVEFNLDGTAKDLSPMKHTVQNVDNVFPYTVAYNTTYKRNVVSFSPEVNGTTTKGSYFRIDYQNNSEFLNKLASGHSFETLVKFNVNYVAAEQKYETKFFSTQQAGGTGFLIANYNQATGNNGITFLPNVAATEGGASRWIWANSQIKPDGQAWYHLVGVWDKDAGKAYLYVNGEKKAEVDAAGFYRPAALTPLWVGIGGDPGNNEIQNTFQGSLTIARIYSKALTAAEAESLWNQVK